MVTFLLIVIYIAFIGLGIPDSLFGTAWPAIYMEYGLPISLGGVITTVTFIGTTISSLLSARLIRKFGTARLTAGCTLLTALALLGFSLSHSFVILFILAIPLGLGAGSIDTALNNYVASHYNASQMSFLHCFYGIGVTVSPFILALVFRNGINWRRGYGIATIIQFVIAAIVIFSLPLWNKVREKNENSESDIKSLSIIEASKIRGVKVMWLLFFCTCSIELTVGAWSSTFLVESRGATQELAARTITFYYLGMTLGREAGFSQEQLVEKGSRQYFVKVTKEFITTHELPGKVDGKRFVIGNHRYTKGYRIVLDSAVDKLLFL